MTTTETAFDSAKAEAFGGRLMSILSGSLLNSMVDIGHRGAQAEAAGAGLTNVTFEVGDIARLTVTSPLDVVFVFDTLHDQADPGAVLARIRDALVPSGLLFMRGPHTADTLAGNLANPMAPVFYSVSTLHCLTVSLAHGGAGIGSTFGEQRRGACWPRQASARLICTRRRAIPSRRLSTSWASGPPRDRSPPRSRTT